jgi:hypothetical protein
VNGILEAEAYGTTYNTQVATLQGGIHRPQPHLGTDTQPMILTSKFPIPVTPWSGLGHQLEMCISDSLRQVMRNNGLQCALLNSVNRQCVSGVSGRNVGSIFKSQDVQNSSWTLLPPQGCK